MSDLITRHLDVWMSALMNKSSAGRGSNGNQTAYGIKKLRELILELAVRGKLVPQDPDDEPASVLLEKIANAKAQLIKEGKLKGQNKLPDIEDNESLREIPKGWAFTRLGEIINVINGRAYKKHEMLQEGTPLLRVGNLFTSDEWYYSDLELEPDKYIENGDLIYAWSASFGPFIWQGGKVIYHYHIWKLDLYDPSCLDKQFLFYFFTSITEKIKASGNGIAMIHMTKERMEKLVLEIPPLPEQKRIVAKVDELMALCDQLEQQQTDSNAAHQTLVETLLGTLTNTTVRAESFGFAQESPVEARPSTVRQAHGSGRTEFKEAWQRIAEHFDTLFTTEHSIDQLKQTILQLAVMGKLVPQDPNDEPASVLLEKTCSNRVQLVDKNKLNQGNVSSPIDDAELPAGWEWLSFGDLGQTIGGGTPSKSNSQFWDGNIPWISPKDMKIDFISESIDSISKEAIEGSAVKLIPAGSLLLVVRGMILAHSFPVAITRVPVTINQDMKAVVINGFDEGYVLLMMKALKMEFIDLVDRSTHGTCKLVSEKLWSKKLPIPPLAEQHRIAAKVDELMALCDALKARINQAKTTQIHLADAIVELNVA